MVVGVQSIAARLAGSQGKESRALQRRGFRVQQLHEVLVVLPDLQVVVALDHAVQRLQRTRHQLQQRALARAVWAHQRNARVLRRRVTRCAPSIVP